jgi:hypothetical protein
MAIEELGSGRVESELSLIVQPENAANIITVSGLAGASALLLEPSVKLHDSHRTGNRNERYEDLQGVKTFGNLQPNHGPESPPKLLASILPDIRVSPIEAAFCSAAIPIARKLSSVTLQRWR